jgi:hypothetical protein
MITIRVLIAAALVACAGPAFAQQCLHGGDEAPEQQVRRQKALDAARAVNTMQAGQPGAAKKEYLSQQDLAQRPSQKPTGSMQFEADAEILPGWRLTLNKAEGGYWFMIRDTTDPCGFTYISNQQGVIYAAEPIR